MTEQDDDLQGAFGDKGTKLNDIDYAHPHADTILEEAKAILAETETGSTFLNGANHHNLLIKIIKSTGLSTYNPEHKTAYIAVPANQTNVKPQQIFDIIKTLREAEQEILGFTAPDKSDMLNYAAVMHAKNLDSIVFICKFVHESETKKTDKHTLFLDEVKRLGYGTIYDGYVGELSDDALYDVYQET